MTPARIEISGRAPSPVQGQCPWCDGRQIKILLSREFQGNVWSLAFCPSCELHFTDPAPTDENIRQFYAGGYHCNLRTEGASEKEFGARFESYTRWITPRVPLGRTLDVGCATGLLPRMLKDRGYAAEGLELDEETARWGSAHYGIPIRVGMFEQVAHEIEAYQLVTLTEVVEHTGNPIECLTRVNQLLSNQGFALVTFPDICSLKSRYYQALSKVTGREWLWLTCHVPFHVWEFSYATAKRCFERTGFRIEGFRRSETREYLPGKLAPLSWFARPLTLGPLARSFGTQMEFLLQKINPV